MQNEFSFRIMLVGNAGVGKSSLLMRYAEGNFRQGFLPTVGVDFKVRTVEQAGSLMRLQLWDSVGQDRLASFNAACWRRAQGLLVVFDLGDRRSFGAVRRWVEEAERLGNGQQVRVLVGNKNDLSSREVTSVQAQQLASSSGMTYFQVSAKTNLNVQEVFSWLAAQMKQKFAQPYIAKYKKTQSYLMPLQKQGKTHSTCF